MKQGLSIFDKIFIHYIVSMKGAVLLVSNDSIMGKIIRSCYKNLGLDDSSFYHVRELANLFKLTSNILSIQKHVILIVERSLSGRSSLEDIDPIKNKFRSQLKTILVSTEVDDNMIALMYESGADNVIIKPIDQNSLVQKIATVLSPNNALDELIDACKIALTNKEVERAEQYVEKILEVKPDSSAGLMLKGDIYLLQSKFDKARACYTKASTVSKYHLEPLKRLVKLFDTIDDLQQKLNYLKKLDEISPLNRERKMQIASDLIKVGELEDAYVFFEEAISLAKREANEILSKTYMDAGKQLKDINFNRSLTYTNKAIKVKGRHLSKEDIWMFNDKGIYLRKHGRNDDAITCFKQALKIAPDDPVINYNLGMAYAESREVELAAKCFDMALDSDRTLVESNASVAYNIGLTYYNARRFEDAYAIFSIGAKNDPENAQLNEMLQTAYDKINY
jgi:tetratricopeptide (TPR) repeat protein